MKILMLSDVFSPLYGGANVVLMLTQRLTEKGIETIILTSDVDCDISSSTKATKLVKTRSFRITFSGSTFWIMPFLHKSILHLIKKESVDLVHCHLLNSFTTQVSGLMRFASLLAKPLVLTGHAVYSGYNNLTLDVATTFLAGCTGRLIIKSADCVTAISKEVQHYMEWLGARNVYLTPNGVDADRFCFSTEGRRVIRERYQIPDSDTLVLFLGRIAYNKGVHLLIEAVPELLNKQPNTSFMIAGKGPLLSKIKDFAKTMRKVIVTGPVPEHEKIFYLSAADIFVLPSFVEGIPLSLLEAGAIGLPAIASRVGGIPEIIQDNYNGFLFRAGDVCDLREKLLHLLSNSSLREFLGKNARKNIERNFGIHVYDKYIKVYDSLV